MTKQKSLIGTEIDRTLRTIEASQINHVHKAFSYDSKTQDFAGSEPTYRLPPFLLGNLINLSNIYKTLGLNCNNILLSREFIISHTPLEVGNSVTIKTFLKDAYEQQASSNPIGFIILESIGCLEKDIAFFCERVIAVRGGFHRGRWS